MTETVKTTNARSITHFIEDGKFAVTDNGEIVWPDTVFTRYNCKAGDIALAGMSEGLRYLMSAYDEAYTLLAFACKREIAQEYLSAQTAVKNLETVRTWMEQEDKNAPFFIGLKPYISQEAYDVISTEIEQAKEVFWAVKAKAKAEFDAAAVRFAEAVGGEWQVALQQEDQVIS